MNLILPFLTQPLATAGQCSVCHYSVKKISIMPISYMKLVLRIAHFVHVLIDYYGSSALDPK